MTQEHRIIRYGVAVENYSLIPSRGEEIAKVRELLQAYPVAFVWAPAGNGKTGFAREFRTTVPNTRYILNVQLANPDMELRTPFDEGIKEETEIIVVDEFSLSSEAGYEAIKTFVDEGKKFVFMTHHPKSRYTDWRKQHHQHLPLMMNLINDYPNAPWVYLRKWK